MDHLGLRFVVHGNNPGLSEWIDRHYVVQRQRFKTRQLPIAALVCLGDGIATPHFQASHATRVADSFG